MKLIVLATLVIVLKLNRVEAFSISLPNDCEQFTWRSIIPYKAHDAINKVVAFFKAPLANKPEHWYISALIDEYAKEARAGIRDVTSNYCAIGKNTDDLFRWRHLHTCEKYLIRYQQIINLLGNNLQCTLSSALLTTETIFMGLMPIVDGQATSRFESYVELYYELGLKSDTRKELNKQPQCVGRMVNEGDRKLAGELDHTHLGRIENLLGKLYIVDASGAEHTAKADLAAHSQVIKDVEDEASKLVTAYVEASRRGQEWNDCHVMAHDLDVFHKEDNQIDKLLLSLELTRNSLNCITAEGDQIIAMNSKTFGQLAVAMYRGAAQILVTSYLTPLQSIVTMPQFTAEADGILAAVFQQFRTQMDLWVKAIDAYETPKRHEFIAQCNTLREHFSTVPQTLMATEDALRVLFKEHAVYVPIILIARNTFNPADTDSLIAEYSRQFTVQFQGTKLNSESQAKAHEMKEHSHFRKYFWLQEIYSHKYNQFLVTSEQAAREIISKLDADTEWASYYTALSDFVDELNKYGKDSFELIHPKA